jgi:hypothetical protein
VVHGRWQIASIYGGSEARRGTDIRGIREDEMSGIRLETKGSTVFLVLDNIRSVELDDDSSETISIFVGDWEEKWNEFRNSDLAKMAFEKIIDAIDASNKKERKK